jgi:uncharacterized protein involved in outer membrane biogenesis
MNIRHKILSAFAVSLVLLVAALGAGAWWLHHNDPVALVRSFAQPVEAATGRKLTFAGPIEVRLLPRLRIVAQDVAFANAAWGTSPDMLRAARIEGEISWRGLLRGEVRLVRLILDGVDAIIETDAHGDGNWVILKEGSPKDDPATAGQSTALAVGEVRVSNSRLRWRDGRSRQEKLLEVDRLDIARKLPGLDEVVLRATLDGRRFEVLGTVPDAATLLDGQAPLPIDLTLTADGVNLAARGRLPRDADGPFEVSIGASITGWETLRAWSGVALALPVPMRLDAKASGSLRRLALDPLTVTVGKYAILGKAGYERTGKRPLATLDLAATDVDLSTAAPPKPAARARAPLFPATKLPFHLIAVHDVDARVRIDRLRLQDGLLLSGLAMEASARSGRLKLQVAGLRLADGTVAAQVDVDASGARPTVRVTASGRQLSLEQLTAVHGRAWLTGGRSNFRIDYAGSGDSPRALAATANGELTLSIGAARVSAGGLEFGGDWLSRLFSTINPRHAADRGTDLECAALRLPAKAGVITVRRSIAYETSKVNVVAAGTFDLRDETLDLGLRPTAKEGLAIGAGQLAELVRVSGPMKSPGVRIDTAGAARAAVSVGGAVATGGLSLIGESLFRRGAADPHPCQTALAGDAAAAEAESKQAAPGGGSFLDRTRRALGGK